MEEFWAKIDEHPNYSVSTTGLIRHDRFNRILTIRQNQTGYRYTHVLVDGKQRPVGIARCVATAFVPNTIRGYDYAPSDTPTHKDGDKTNNHANNLAWRPRWYSIVYQQQFHEPNHWIRFERPIRCIETGENFPNSWEAAKHFCLLDMDIYQALYLPSGRTGCMLLGLNFAPL